MSTVTLPYDIARAHPGIQLRYVQLIQAGNTPRFAEMLALQAAPRALTDRELFADVGTLDKQFAGNQHQLDHIVATARAHGYEPNINDMYQPSLARFGGDPQAFVPPTGGRNHIRRLSEARGAACHGAVEVKHRQPDNPPESLRLAPDLVEEIIERKVAENPDLARVDRRELAAEVVHQHGFTDDKRFGVVDEKPQEARRPSITVTPGAKRTKRPTLQRS